MLNVGDNIVDLRTNGTKNIGIFYDSAIERVCTIKTKGKESTTISAKSTNPADHEITFDIREKCRRVRAVSFSLDLQIVSIQQEDTLIEFVWLQEGKVAVNFEHICNMKGAAAVVLGVHWLSNSQIAFVTDAGCEFHMVNAYKRSLKLIQRLAMAIRWHCFYAPSKLFVCASGAQNAMLTCMTFQQNAPHSLGTFEVDFGCSLAKPRLLERDIGIASIYGKLCILVLKFESDHGFATGLNVYELVPSEPQRPLQLKCFLGFDLVGLVGLHVVDNLVLVHHKNAQSTLIFDIRLSTEHPICSTQLCCCVSSPAASSAATNGAKGSVQLFDAIQREDDDDQNNEGKSTSGDFLRHRQLSPDTFLYNSAWQMCMSDVVLDLQHELFTRVQLKLEHAEHTLLHNGAHDLDFLIRFLINRRDSEFVLLELLQRSILHKTLKFSRVTHIFRQILREDTSQSDDDANSNNGGAGQVECQCPPPKWFPQAVPFVPLTVTHNSLLRDIFEPLYQRRDEMDKRSLANLMMEFFLILKQKNVKVQETYVSELLVKMLVAAGMFDRLQQLLQYSVIEKSKFLAYELIALSSHCPALYPIGLDMLKRRNDWEQIVEVLMTRGHLLEALRLLLKTQIDRTVFNKTLRRLLDRTWKSHDRQLMYTVFAHVLHTLGRKQLAEVMTSQSGDDFERYTQEFKLLYDPGEVKEAAQRFREARLSSIRRRSDTNATRNDSFTSASGDGGEEDALIGREAATELDNTSSSSGGTDQ